jgi:hypothetical protein
MSIAVLADPKPSRRMILFVAVGVALVVVVAALLVLWRRKKADTTSELLQEATPAEGARKNYDEVDYTVAREQYMKVKAEFETKHQENDGKASDNKVLQKALIERAVVGLPHIARIERDRQETIR